jgi:glycosyltransferase involved in cell wall biosynthesis
MVAARPRAKLAIVVTHPIQYFSHVYRQLAAYRDMRVKVFYGARIGLDRYMDPGFGVELAWECDLVGGFEHEFLAASGTVKRLDWNSLARVRVADALSQFDPDSVLLHGYSNPLVLRAWRWAQLRGRRTILFGDGNGRSELRRGLCKRLAKRTLLAPVLRSFTRVLSLGEANALYWELLGVDRSRVQLAPLYLPSPEVTLPAGPARDRARAEVRAELEVGDSDLLVMYSGKMVPWKRAVDLVHAVDQCDRLVGLYVGDGPCRVQYQSAAKSTRHRFVGFANIPELARYYAAADVLCHPAECEPYGLVVAEAAASGLPIVVSRAVGAFGIGSHGQERRNALAFDPGDVAYIRRNLESLADDRTLRVQLAAESVVVADEVRSACFKGVRACVLGATVQE